MSLFIYTLRSVAGAIVTPPLTFLLIALMIVLHFKNKKLIAMQKIILGGSVNSSIELTLSQLVLGVIGGCVGSLIMTSLGVMFNEDSGIGYLFITSILLMFIRPKLICFAYSGAILGFISIMINSASIVKAEFLNINIFYLVILIGIFHIIEGILVIIDGDRGAVPVFTNKDGKILGGYALKRCWVLPIAMMIVVSIDKSASNFAVESIQSFNWWPLIKSSSGFALLISGAIHMSPFYTMLGYSSVTFTRTKREKALSSGIYILIYGAIIIAVSQIAKFGILGEMLVLAFMPFAHEYMLKFQLKNEEKRIPKFVSDEEGLVILEISTDSKVREFGVNVENKLISINDKSVNSEAEIYSIIRDNLYNAILKIKDSHGSVKDVKFRHDRNTRIGILLVPRNVNKEDVIPIKGNTFKSVFNGIKEQSKK